MKLKIDDAFKKVINRCKEKDYEFNGWLNNEWVGNTTYLKLKCNKCGNEWETTTYSNFVNKNNGCPNCKRKSLSEQHFTKEDEYMTNIQNACKEKNVSFVGFNNIENAYFGDRTKLVLKCNECGNVWGTTTYGHFVHENVSCPKCKKSNKDKCLKLKCALENLKEKTHNEYDFSLVKEYVNTREKLNIICHKKYANGEEHGVFPMSYEHLMRGQGCPKCNASHLENEMRRLLSENKIEFVEQKRFNWLGNQSLDFYIPSKNIAIECQGGQHFQPIEYFGGEEEFLIIKERDRKKNEMCKEHNIKILYYSNLGIDYPYHVFENKMDLINEIIKE